MMGKIITKARRGLAVFVCFSLLANVAGSASVSAFAPPGQNQPGTGVASYSAFSAALFQTEALALAPQWVSKPKGPAYNLRREIRDQKKRSCLKLSIRWGSYPNPWYSPAIVTSDGQWVGGFGTPELRFPYPFFHAADEVPPNPAPAIEPEPGAGKYPVDPVDMNARVLALCQRASQVHETFSGSVNSITEEEGILDKLNMGLLDRARGFQQVIQTNLELFPYKEEEAHKKRLLRGALRYIQDAIALFSLFENESGRQRYLKTVERDPNSLEALCLPYSGGVVRGITPANHASFSTLIKMYMMDDFSGAISEYVGGLKGIEADLQMLLHDGGTGDEPDPNSLLYILTGNKTLGMLGIALEAAGLLALGRAFAEGGFASGASGPYALPFMLVTLIAYSLIHAVAGQRYSRKSFLERFSGHLAGSPYLLVSWQNPLLSAAAVSAHFIRDVDKMWPCLLRRPAGLPHSLGGGSRPRVLAFARSA